MPLQEQSVNIYEYPTEISTVEGNKNQSTIGDLHGNAVRLIFHLIKEGVVTTTQENYSRLVEIYQKSFDWKNVDEQTIKNDIIDFQDCLTKLTATGQYDLVRLIGDELCDRGSNDWLTLLIFQRMHELKVPLRVIFSNHTEDFIRNFENQSYQPRLLSGNSGDRADTSFYNFQFLKQKKIINDDNVNTVIRDSYKPTLCALDYSIDPSTKNITIYSHAGIGLETVAGLARLFNVNYDRNKMDHSNPEIRNNHLIEVIDGINNGFAAHVRQNRISEIVDATLLDEIQDYSKNEPPYTVNQLEKICFNRVYTQLDRGEKIVYVHGHDTESTANPDQVIVMNSDLGKRCENVFSENGMSYNETNVYQALITQHTLSNALTPSTTQQDQQQCNQAAENKQVLNCFRKVVDHLFAEKDRLMKANKTDTKKYKDLEIILNKINLATPDKTEDVNKEALKQLLTECNTWARDKQNKWDVKKSQSLKNWSEFLANNKKSFEPLVGKTSDYIITKDKKNTRGSNQPKFFTSVSDDSSKFNREELFPNDLTTTNEYNKR